MLNKKKHLRSQGKEIISKVYHRMKFEAEHGIENLSDARWRTAQAVGYSQRTISNILKEERLSKSNTCIDTGQNIFKSPTKRMRGCPKSSLDSFDMSVLRRTLMSFHDEFNETPTLKKLKEVMAEKIGFDGSIETLRKCLRESGYEWANIDDHRRVLIEKHEIQMSRLRYLTQLNKYRDEGRYIVYTDETFVQASQKIIIVHAGGCQGFIPNAFLMFKANSSGDYHDNIPFENYKLWFINQLLPNLPEKAVIVLDNASYHNRPTETCPNPYSNKNTMQEWLNKNNIPFEQSLKKIELYDLVLKNKEKFTTYVVDQIANSKGFEILRLPPCHPDLNAIEIIWGNLKNYVNERNFGLTLASTMALVQERIDMIDSSMWEATCRHVCEVEKQYLKNFDTDSEFIINMESDTDDSDMDD